MARLYSLNIALQVIFFNVNFYGIVDYIKNRLGLSFRANRHTVILFV